jgi:hypothetical protein
MRTKNISSKEDMKRIGFSKKTTFPLLTLKSHNILDYGLNFLFFTIPFIFGISRIGSVKIIFIIMGATLLLYNLFTDYYYSFVKYIPFGLHRALDMIIGVLLMTAPSSFGYKSELSIGQLMIHILLGGVLLISALFTKTLTLAEIGEEVGKEDSAA